MVNIFFIDFETTGLNPYHNHPIEVAIKKLDSDSYYQTFIKPPINGIHYKYVSPKIQSITNITDEMIEENGIDNDTATFNILEYIKLNSEEGDIYMVAHNGICFDFLILKKLFRDYGNHINKRITRRNSLDKSVINRIKFIDSLLLSRLSIKGESYSQPSLCRRFGIKNEQEHRAIGDILALEELYGKLTLHLSYSNNSNEDIFKNNPYEVYKQTNIC
tara:strand:+ start:2665 stop:3318 length:654 start_codon:yes stop_codon:yes gene_type:complete